MIKKVTMGNLEFLRRMMMITRTKIKEQKYIEFLINIDSCTTFNRNS